MISKYKNNGLVWIDLTSPSEEEIAYILDEYQISENIRQEIESSGKDHKTAIENGTFFTILRLPKSKQEENVDKVIIIKNRDYVITIHDQPIDSISQFSSDLELDMAIPTESNIKNQELLLAHLLRKMFVGLHDKILLKDIDGYKKIKKFFIDEKIARNLRDEIILLATADEILWICGYRRCNKYLVNESSKKVLYLHFDVL